MLQEFLPENAGSKYSMIFCGQRTCTIFFESLSMDIFNFGETLSTTNNNENLNTYCPMVMAKIPGAGEDLNVRFPN